METLRDFLPILNKGLIFRARRVQLDLTLIELQNRSGVGLAALRSLELSAAADLDTVRTLAPHLELTVEQAIAMLAIQREEMVPECLKDLLRA